MVFKEANYYFNIKKDNLGLAGHLENDHNCQVSRFDPFAKHILASVTRSNTNKESFCIKRSYRANQQYFNLKFQGLTLKP
jgi:hypothetical protein